MKFIKRLMNSYRSYNGFEKKLEKVIQNMKTSCSVNLYILCYFYFYFHRKIRQNFFFFVDKVKYLIKKCFQFTSVLIGLEVSIVFASTPLFRALLCSWEQREKENEFGFQNEK